jgi:hypothetical protein
MRIIFQMDKVHNVFCINGIAAHIFDGWRWVGGGRLLAFPSICPYGFHTRGGSWPYRVGVALGNGVCSSNTTPAMTAKDTHLAQPHLAHVGEQMSRTLFHCASPRRVVPRLGRDLAWERVI